MLHNFGNLVHLEVVDPETGVHVARGEEVSLEEPQP
jgi:hypothetical protein